MLLAHRHPLREWYPDCWDLVGGHVETGESSHEAVIRECYEELGVRVHNPLPIPMTFNDSTLDVHAFLVTRWDGEPVNSAPEEHDDLPQGRGQTRRVAGREEKVHTGHGTRARAVAGRVRPLACEVGRGGAALPWTGCASRSSGN